MAIELFDADVSDIMFQNNATVISHIVAAQGLGANNSGDLAFKTSAAGTSAEAMRITCLTAKLASGLLRQNYSLKFTLHLGMLDNR